MVKSLNALVGLTLLVVILVIGCDFLGTSDTLKLVVQIDETKRPTKAQREFLYDYYVIRNCKAEAKRWLDDGL